MARRVAVVLVLAGLGVPCASAQVPAGGEFQVNTYTTGQQLYPSAASDAAGNVIVVWTGYGQDGSESGVFGQRYDSSGAPRGSEFRVNTYSTHRQNSASAAAAPAGHFVVVWSSEGEDGDGWGVFGQRYDSSLAPVGMEFQVNTYYHSSQSNAAVASDAAGGFVVTWSSEGQDGNEAGVFARRYDSSGAPRGGELQVNTYTTSSQAYPAVASDGAGHFVVVWQSFEQDGEGWGVFAQRFDPSGTPQGVEFRVNTHTTSYQVNATVASDARGNFVVVWASEGQDGSSSGVFGQRYDASGTARGSEFRVNTYVLGYQGGPSTASDVAGDFVVTWHGEGPGDALGIHGQRYDASGLPRGPQFLVNEPTTESQYPSVVVSNAVGDFTVVWQSSFQDGSQAGVFGRRFGGLQPAALAADASATADSDGNGVLEPGESVAVAPSWRNVNGAAQTFAGGAVSFSGPAASGVSYELPDAAAAYGTVANGATAACSDCYQVGVSFGGTRPSLHWDATFTERLTPDVLGQTKPWLVHVGESFTDVPATSGFYRFVETLLHKGVTAGCSTTDYCPASTVTREQLSVFVLVGKEGTGYGPAACTTPVFGDVPASSPFCRWVEELSRRGVVSGCGGGNYCPGHPVTREQMPVFVLKTLDPAIDPPACGTPAFTDVPASSPFCRWIEELARRGVVSGCGGGNYCPSSPVTREQMAVFISVTFGLILYGP